MTSKVQISECDGVCDNGIAFAIAIAIAIDVDEMSMLDFNVLI